MSATLAGIRLRALDIPPDVFAAIQTLTSAVVMTLSRPQAVPADAAGGAPTACDRRLLWRFGMSGDRPVVLVFAGTSQGVSGVLVYMTIYLVMTLGTFAAVLSMRIGDTYVEKISDLSGLARTNGTMAFFLAMMMFSLAGSPPLAGFFAKWYVFNAAIQAHLYWLAVIGVLSSTVACYYYLRIVKIMYFDEPAPAFSPASLTVRAIYVLAGVAVLLFWVFPGPIVAAADSAARSLF